MPSADGGSQGGTAQKNGSAVRARKFGAGRLNLTTSVYPRATTPRAFSVLPVSTSSAPTMSA